MGKRAEPAAAAERRGAVVIAHSDLEGARTPRAMDTVEHLEGARQAGTAGPCSLAAAVTVTKTARP